MQPATATRRVAIGFRVHRGFHAPRATPTWSSCSRSGPPPLRRCLGHGVSVLIAGLAGRRRASRRCGPAPERPMREDVAPSEQQSAENDRISRSQERQPHKGRQAEAEEHGQLRPMEPRAPAPSVRLLRRLGAGAHGLRLVRGARGRRLSTSPGSAGTGSGRQSTAARAAAQRAVAHCRLPWYWMVDTPLT